MRIEAKNLEQALMKAARELECSVVDIEYEVVQYHKSGFLGLFQKNAIIEAKSKKKHKFDNKKYPKKPYDKSRYNDTPRYKEREFNESKSYESKPYENKERKNYESKSYERTEFGGKNNERKDYHHKSYGKDFDDTFGD